MSEVGDHASEQLPFSGLLPEVVRDAVEATRLEAKAGAAAAPDTLELRDGHPIGSIGAERLWSFELVDDVMLLPETPGALLVEGFEPISAKVLAVGDASLVVGLHDEVGESVRAALLSFQAGFIYESLIQRLETAALDPAASTELIDQLLLPDPEEGFDGKDALDPPEPTTADEDQLNAADRALLPGLRFTWGPPGTGKTNVLAMAVAEAVERGQRVLVVAHANAAVDVAVTRVAERMEGTEALERGHVLRIGTPHLPGARNRTDVLPEHIVARSDPDRTGRREHLEQRRREASDAARSSAPADRAQAKKELSNITTELAEIDRAVRAQIAELVDDAVVIATTLARHVIDTKMWDWTPDVIILDEASMAGLPFVLALATRGAATLSCFGDFRQLPPIAISKSEDAQRWFARDVFELAEVVDAHDQGRPDSRLTTLRTQFRMGEQICEVVNQFAYGGLLRTDRSARDRAIRAADRWPAVGSEVIVVDTSGLGGPCLTEAAPDAFSRFAPSSAAVAATAAEVILKEGGVDVGLISPYRAHTSLLASFSRHLPGATAATVHRFQGSERDVAIVDLVDGPDQASASRLTGGDPDLALRLLNVAASRARAKLVILADLEFIGRAHPLTSPARALLECADQAGALTIDAVDLITTAPAGDDDSRFTWFPDWDAASADFAGEVFGAQRAVAQLPDPSFAGRWFEEAVDGIRDAEQLTLRVPHSIAGTVAGKKLDIRLQVLGRTPWALVGGKVLWLGAGATDHPVVRVDGERAASAFQRLILRE